MEVKNTTPLATLVSLLYNAGLINLQISQNTYGKATTSPANNDVIIWVENWPEKFKNETARDNFC